MNRNVYFLIAVVKLYEYSIGIYFLALGIIYDTFISDKDLRLKDEDFTDY